MAPTPLARMRVRSTARTPLGRMLVDDGRITEVQLRTAVERQTRWGGRIGEALVAMGYVTERVMLGAVARQLDVPYLELGDRRVPPGIVRLVPERIIRLRRVFPIALISTRRGPLVVALSDPADLGAVDEVAFACGLDVKPVLASDADIDRAIARHLDGVIPMVPTPVELPPDPGPLPLVSGWRN